MGGIPPHRSMMVAWLSTENRDTITIIISCGEHSLMRWNSDTNQEKSMQIRTTGGRKVIIQLRSLRGVLGMCQTCSSVGILLIRHCFGLLENVWCTVEDYQKPIENQKSVSNINPCAEGKYSQIRRQQTEFGILFCGRGGFGNPGSIWVTVCAFDESNDAVSDCVRWMLFAGIGVSEMNAEVSWNRILKLS